MTSEFDDWALLGADGYEVVNKIRIQEGKHYDIVEKEVLPYRLVKNLGIGASASVEMVEDVISGFVYARKVFRNVTTRNLEQVKKGFLNEVQIIQRLASHHHIIRVFATYTAGREFGLILQPVADGGDLATFLAACWDVDELDQPSRGILYSCFGCLSDGLSFMHQRTIRHKDIKPHNILIHRGSPIYTDFGLSYDFSLSGHSTTGGHPGMFTRRYCSPEVADFGPRNSKSDVFSLGCVLLEAFMVLYRSLPPEVLNEAYYKQLESLQAVLVESTCNSEKDQSFMANIISKMLAHHPEDRPSADIVAYQLQTTSRFELDVPFFCKLCTSNLQKRLGCSMIVTKNQQDGGQEVGLDTVAHLWQMKHVKGTGTIYDSPTFTESLHSGRVLNEDSAFDMRQRLEPPGQRVRQAPMPVSMNMYTDIVESQQADYREQHARNKEDNDNPLVEASEYGHEKIVQILLDKGADIKAQGVDYANVLEFAISHGHQAIVKMLQDRVVEANCPGDEYYGGNLCAVF
ncbi:kinase-like protein [Lophium mytilinum]|uniref:non-specific serine/threonine protein kinase n=1 Tax=Lophium mytilinum TaxID=390894 RepID=A0A6A6R6K6_9PEZI|nr:kinase-like protein [Lophium mytilinum]